jgi:hypothetical protein
MNMAKIRIGDVVSGSVVEHRCGRVMIRLENHLLAFVDTSSLSGNITANPHSLQYTNTCFQGDYRQGSTAKGVVIDVDFANAVVQLSLDQNIVNHIHKPNQTKLN